MTIDKKAHFLAGAAIAATVALYADPIYGLAAGIAAGIAKEIYDRMGYGTPDFKDLAATALGAAVVVPSAIW